MTPVPRLEDTHESMKRTISHYDVVLDLLQDLIQAAIPTNLVIASSKADFLQQLVSALLSSQATSETLEIPSSQDDDHIVDQHSPSEPAIHPLLIPTLHQLATSKQIHLAFCPTIDSLRAYLASHAVPPSHIDGQPPALQVVLLNAIGLHHGTSEFSLQGLSRTLALAVSSAAARRALHLKLIELADIDDPTNPAYGHRLWDAQVPLLNGSVRLAGEGASWAGRVIKVRMVAGRWFEFEKSQPPDNVPEENKRPVDKATEEMLV